MAANSGKFHAKFHNNHKRGWSCSPVMIFTWFTIFLWIAFLIYCVNHGLINSTQVSVMVENTELLMDKNSLRGHDHPAIPTTEHLTQPKQPAVDHSHDIYVVFSTDCTPYQDWQSLVLFHSAKLVKQPGVITRIASGCNEEKQKQLSKLYRDLYGNYCTVHFTPDFKKDAKTQRSYDFYNKPWGLKHWLDYANPPIPSHALVALLDPDMAFLRPITLEIGTLPNIVSKRIPKKEIGDNITLGHPVAQTYGLGAPWAREKHKHFDKYKICGQDSPCVKPDEAFAEMHYSVGPPYVMVKEDFIRIANSWTTLVPK
jgi:peptidyl serine alpha-galactosyltransferase